MLFGAVGDLDVGICEYADDASGYFVVDDGFIVFAYDIDAEFLALGG
jgi:hypothetical protein